MGKNIKNLVRNKLHQVISNFKGNDYGFFGEDNFNEHDYDVLYHPEIINKAERGVYKFNLKQEDFGVNKKTKFNKTKNVIRKIQGSY